MSFKICYFYFIASNYTNQGLKRLNLGVVLHCGSGSSSHQGRAFKLQHDMLQEDQQVGGPSLQSLYAVEGRTLLLCHHIVLKVFVLSPDDGHG